MQVQALCESGCETLVWLLVRDADRLDVAIELAHAYGSSLPAGTLAQLQGRRIALLMQGSPLEQGMGPAAALRALCDLLPRQAPTLSSSSSTTGPASHTSTQTRTPPRSQEEPAGAIRRDTGTQDAGSGEAQTGHNGVQEAGAGVAGGPLGAHSRGEGSGGSREGSSKGLGGGAQGKKGAGGGTRLSVLEVMLVAVQFVPEMTGKLQLVSFPWCWGFCVHFGGGSGALSPPTSDKFACGCAYMHLEVTEQLMLSLALRYPRRISVIALCPVPCASGSR